MVHYYCKNYRIYRNGCLLFCFQLQFHFQFIYLPKKNTVIQYIAFMKKIIIIMVQVVGVVASKVTGQLLRQHGIDGGVHLSVVG